MTTKKIVEKIKANDNRLGEKLIQTLLNQSFLEGQKSSDRIMRRVIRFNKSQRIRTDKALSDIRDDVIYSYFEHFAKTFPCNNSTPPCQWFNSSKKALLTFGEELSGRVEERTNEIFNQEQTEMFGHE